jgi:hypothetical protein
MIGSSNIYRAAKTIAVSIILDTPPPLSVIKFSIKVAYAYYSDTTPFKA